MTRPLAVCLLFAFLQASFSWADGQGQRIPDWLPVHWAQDASHYPIDISLSLVSYDFVRPLGANGMLWDMPETMAAALSESSLLHAVVGRTLIGEMPDTRWGILGAGLSLGIAEAVGFYLPGGEGWLHEEWHRAVLANRGISAQDDMIFFPFLKNIVSVSHVSDADLAQLKAQHPSDFVRLSEAGYEADISFAFRLKQRAFFERERFDLDRTQAFAVSLSAVAYLMDCAFGDPDPSLAAMDQAEASSIQIRDIVGYDFLSWVYDLFRPDEPYSARGVHPSGLGINRYVKQSQLSQAERDYLSLQAILASINVVLGGFDLFLPDRISVSLFNTPMDLSASIRHYLTSFGFLIDSTLLAHIADLKLVISVRNYFNQNAWFPGVAVSLVELPLRLGSYSIFLSADGAVWSQPLAQSFTTTTGAIGGSGSLRIDLPITPKAAVFVQGDAKSPGWEAGSVQLDAAYHIRGGVTFQM